MTTLVQCPLCHLVPPHFGYKVSDFTLSIVNTYYVQMSTMQKSYKGREKL